MKKDIQINRLFTGNYLKTGNLGHEIINIFRCDNGCIYIYTMPTGDYADIHRGQVKKIILTRTIDSNRAQILAIADVENDILAEQIKKIEQNLGKVKYTMLPSVKKLKDKTNLKPIHEKIHALQRDYINENKISYGGIKLYDLFKDNITEKSDGSIYVTYKVSNYMEPKEEIYFVNNKFEIDNKIGNQKKIDQKYFKLGRKRLCGIALQIYESSDSKEIERLVNSDFWIRNFNLRTVSEAMLDLRDEKIPFLSLIKKNNDELIYSNWIAYYLKKDRNLLNLFILNFTQENIEKIPSKEISFIREKDNIDLYYEDPYRIIIFENKILSSINGIKKVIFKNQNNQLEETTEEGKIKSQLSKYFKTIKRRADKTNKEIRCYLLLPNYTYKDESKLAIYDCSEFYEIIRYSELYSFFSRNTSDLPFFNEFIKALNLHSKSYRNELYDEMINRFYNILSLDNS